jgi:ABC-type Fe3+/spermidine/putrescine transport system ATPase subunit
MAVIELGHVSKRFGAVSAVDDFSLNVEVGECVCLFGPSACGKTTTLRLIAGLEDADSGRVAVAGADKNRIAMVFQDGALWPHMSVRRHIEFVLRGSGVSRRESRDRASAIVETFRLSGRDHDRPAQLSGGQQQRLALARAFATDPPILLLDEPFTSLDGDLRAYFVDLCRKRLKGGATIVIASHDAGDAEDLADKVVEMG